MSTVQEIYKLFYESRWAAVPQTTEKANGTMNAFWSVLISSGFKFEKRDLIELRAWAEENCRRAFYSPHEGHYGLSVRESNISFAQAYEAYMGRKPFIFTGIDYGMRYSGFVCHGSGKTKGRLVVRADFRWKGEKVTVTSFNDEKNVLIACAYHPNKKADYCREKIRKRFTITHEDLQEAKRKLGEEKQ